MTLDLAKLSPQVRRLAGRLLEQRDGFRQRREQATATLAGWSERWEELRDLAERRERAQRLASPREPLLTAVPLPPLPPDHQVIATDGSQIEPDRHGPTEFYVLNVGWAVLRYGAGPAARLDSQPMLACEPDELFVLDDTRRRRVPVQGAHLAARRARVELEMAGDLAAAGDELPLVILQDGTLLLWVLEERPEDFLREEFLRPYCAALRRCQSLERPVASYISRPRSTELSALLRAGTCGGDPTDCPPCLARADGQCAFDALHDRLLLGHLGAGERSALFAAVLNEKIAGYYAGQRIHFFYVNVGSEIARVEVPEWVADDPAWLGLVQSVIYDQCQRGQGYPVALARAHECAVVRGGDRLAVRYLLETVFARNGLLAALSEKETAKRVRAV